MNLARRTSCILQLRMRNYATPNRRGVCKASESVVTMFKTEKGRFLAYELDELLFYIHFKFRPRLDHSISRRQQGLRLRELLLKHGTFDEVEVQITKYRKEEEENQLEGGFYTKIDLEKEGWNSSLPHQLYTLYSFDFKHAWGFSIFLDSILFEVKVHDRA